MSRVPGLCNTCAKLLTAEDWPNKSHEGPVNVFAKTFVFYIYHLAVASAKGCRICRVVVGDAMRAVGKLNADVVIEVEYWIHSALSNWHLRVFPCIQGERFHPAVCRFHLWAEPIRQIKSPLSAAPAHTLAPKSSFFSTISIARKWLHDCTQEYQTCDRNRDKRWVPPPPPGPLPAYHPARLL